MRLTGLFKRYKGSAGVASVGGGVGGGVIESIVSFGRINNGVFSRGVSKSDYDVVSSYVASLGLVTKFSEVVVTDVTGVAGGGEPGGVATGATSVAVVTDPSTGVESLVTTIKMATGNFYIAGSNFDIQAVFNKVISELNETDEVPVVHDEDEWYEGKQITSDEDDYFHELIELPDIFYSRSDEYDEFVLKDTVVDAEAKVDVNENTYSAQRHSVRKRSEPRVDKSRMKYSSVVSSEIHIDYINGVTYELKRVKTIDNSGMSDALPVVYLIEVKPDTAGKHPTEVCDALFKGVSGIVSKFEKVFQIERACDRVH